MNNGKVSWSGNFPAVVSPFKENGEIDEAKFIENIELLVSEGADGVVISGSNGESWALKPDEKLRLFRLAAETAKGKFTVIGGTGSIITEDVAELTKAAKETGIDGAMIMPPYYAGVGKRETIAHYQMISDVAKFPILIYNSPKSTGINVVGDLVEALADIEWVCGIKQSTLDYMEFSETVSLVGERLAVFTGHSSKRGMAAVVAGGVGFVSSLDPHVMGAEGISLFRLAKEGRIEEARRIQQRTLDMDRRLNGIVPGPAVMKAAMNLLGRPGGYTRRPNLPLTTEQMDRVAAVLSDLGLLERRAA